MSILDGELSEIKAATFEEVAKTLKEAKTEENARQLLDKLNSIAETTISFCLSKVVTIGALAATPWFAIDDYARTLHDKGLAENAGIMKGTSLTFPALAMQISASYGLPFHPMAVGAAVYMTEGASAAILRFVAMNTPDIPKSS